MAHMVKCVECGKEFEGQRKTAVFCSDLCRATYAKREPRIQQLANEIRDDMMLYGRKLRRNLKPQTRDALLMAKFQIEFFLKEDEKLKEIQE